MLGTMAEPGTAPNQSKNKVIVVCCDGTACTAYLDHGKHPHTNVARIARCIKPVADNGTTQIVHYMPGIGTGEENKRNLMKGYNQGIGKGIK